MANGTKPMLLTLSSFSESSNPFPRKRLSPSSFGWLRLAAKELRRRSIQSSLLIRLTATYERKGYTREWINQRLMAISARKELTDEWKDRGVLEGKDYAILTDELTRAWSGMSTRQYKDLKGLKKESLRDNMSTTELVLNMLAETATKEISQAEQPEGFSQNKRVAQRGGNIAGEARKAIERESGKPVITSQNAAQLNHVVTQMIEASVAVSEETEEESGES